MLELSIETLNDAGLPPLGLQGTRTGTFIGITTHDYMTLQIRANSPEDVDAYTGPVFAANFAAGRCRITCVSKVQLWPSTPHAPAA